MPDFETVPQLRWHLATNPVQPPKIANMQMRMDLYRTAMRGFVPEMALLSLSGACLAIAFAYFAPAFVSALYPGIEFQREHLWMLVGATYLFALVVWCLATRPRRPLESDVLADVALRRQVGLNDSVADESETLWPRDQIGRRR